MTMREQRARKLDSIWTANYMLIYNFFIVIENFTVFQGWATDDCRGSCSQAATKPHRRRAVPQGDRGILLRPQLSVDTRIQSGSSHPRARERGQGCAVIQWDFTHREMTRRAARPTASPAAPHLASATQLSIGQTLINCSDAG